MFIILWMHVASFIPRLFAALCKEPGVWLWMSGVANSPATMDEISLSLLCCNLAISLVTAYVFGSRAQSNVSSMILNCRLLK